MAYQQHTHSILLLNVDACTVNVAYLVSGEHTHCAYVPNIIYFMHVLSQRRPEQSRRNGYNWQHVDAFGGISCGEKSITSCNSWMIGYVDSLEVLAKNKNVLFMYVCFSKLQ